MGSLLRAEVVLCLVLSQVKIPQIAIGIAPLYDVQAQRYIVFLIIIKPDHLRPLHIAPTTKDIVIRLRDCASPYTRNLDEFVDNKCLIIGAYTSERYVG